MQQAFRGIIGLEVGAGIGQHCGHRVPCVIPRHSFWHLDWFLYWFRSLKYPEYPHIP